MNNKQPQNKLILSQAAEELLEKVSQFKVHSIFENGLNLAFGQDLLYVGRNTQPLAAQGVLVPSDVFDTIKERVEIGTIVRVAQNVWTIYSRPTLLKLEWAPLEEIDLTIPQQLEFNREKMTRLLTLLEQVDPYSQSGFKTSEDQTQLLTDWAAQRVTDEELARRLIGAGRGLTPSGDDFLQGMMTMEYVLNQPIHWEPIVRQALTERSTTDISVSYYGVLMDKKTVNATWIAFFDAIAEGNQTEIEQGIRQIQWYGATSGNDLLMGVLYYLKYIYLT